MLIGALQPLQTSCEQSYGAKPSRCPVRRARGALLGGRGCPATELAMPLVPLCFLWLGKGLPKRGHGQMEQSAQAGIRLSRETPGPPALRPSLPSYSNHQAGTAPERCPGPLLVQQRERD